MAPLLSQELTAALQASHTSSLEVVDPASNRVYYIVDQQTHQQAMLALQKQQDLAAIRQGIAEMEAGQTIPLDIAMKEIQDGLKSRV